MALPKIDPAQLQMSLETLHMIGGMMARMTSTNLDDLAIVRLGAIKDDPRVVIGMALLINILSGAGDPNDKAQLLKMLDEKE